MLNLLLADINQETLNVSIASIVVSAFISILTIINTILLTRRDRKQQAYREVIAKQRLKDYNDIREYLSIFLHNLNEILGTKKVFDIFDKSYCDLMCQFKPQYSEDQEILKELAQLKSYVCEFYFQNKCDNVDKIKKLANKIKNKILAYCAANWQCIKAELGKTKMKHENTSESYNDILNKIEKNDEK